MTVAVLVKVHGGVVLAADSATSMPLFQAGPSGPVPMGFQVYNGANKVFHLHRKLPVGAMTWGLGTIGSASIETIAKDLRRRFMGKDPNYPDWELDPNSYTIAQIAERLIDLAWDELYTTQYPGTDGVTGQTLGFAVAGYPPQGREADAYTFLMSGNAQQSTRPQVEPVMAGESGWRSWASPEATVRLFSGIDPRLLGELQATLSAPDWANVMRILGKYNRVLVHAGMPFADAIEKATFLVDVTTGYMHHILGADTVGGLTEVAGINQYEGFRWVSRKHYYSPTLNPKETSHA